MLGLINAVTATFGAIDRYVKQGLVMANRFLTPPKLSHPAQGSAEFDGSSDYIQLDTPFSYTNHTIAAWVYVNNTSQAKFIFDNRDVASDGILLYMRYSEAPIYAVNSSNVIGTTTHANEWVYVTGTYDGTTMRLYINGSENITKTVSLTINTSSDSTIGKQNYSDAEWFDGNLANVAIWNRALSSDEINAVMWKGYEALTSGEKNGLQAWYKLQESELFDVSDTSTTNLEKYAKLNSLTFEGKTCLQTALDGFPDITDARMHAGKYDIRVAQDGGNVESLSCVETELNALL